MKYLWPRPLPDWFWDYARWVDNGRKKPRPATIPRVVPPWAFARYLLHGSKGQPKPLVQPSLFSNLGGFVAQAGSFPPDTLSAQAFRDAGGKWLAVQFGDPATDQGNRGQFKNGWADRWRDAGVQVGGWWRVEQVGIPIPQTPPVDFLIPNPEQPHEMERTEAILRKCRALMPDAPLACMTLGKAQLFPTGTLAETDAHLILECFLETAESDTTPTESIRYWLASKVPLERIHCALLFKTGYDTPFVSQSAEARMLGSKGLSAFVSENTPAPAWKAMA